MTLMTLSTIKLSITTLRIITLSITLSNFLFKIAPNVTCCYCVCAMTFIMTTNSLMTIGLMMLSTIKLSITTLGIMALSIALRRLRTQTYQNC